jgi:hypothetical protein
VHLLYNRLTRGLKSENKRIFGNAFNKRTDKPAEADRDAPGQRDCVALDINTVFGLIETPIRIKAPEKPVIVTDWDFALLWLSGAFDLRNTSAIGARKCVILVEQHVMDVIFGVEHNCNDVNLFEPEKDVKVISRMREKFRFKDLWLVIF